MSRAGVAGPLFVSVGRPDQLAKFLELNPELSQAKALIDDSPDFKGYRAAGFNYLMGDKALAKRAARCSTARCSPAARPRRPARHGTARRGEARAAVGTGAAA